MRVSGLHYWIILIAVILIYCDSTASGWGRRRRRRRRTCTTHSCTWHWGSCSAICDGGIQYPVKTRQQGSCGSCNMPSGPQKCNTHCCRVDCTWYGWGSWSSCSRSCGVGTRTRSRGKSSRSCGGSECNGASTESQSCNTQCCPVHCSWATWGNWGSCSARCGGGKRSRSRAFSIAASCNGNICPGLPGEVADCNTQCCPVNCEWAPWNNWGSCSVTCGGGTQSRDRGESRVKSCEGLSCAGESIESRQCNQVCCPVDCVWNNWHSWSSCTRSCGSGVRSRIRSVNTPANCDGRQCQGPSKDSQSCNNQCCPVDCVWNEWQPWSSCTKTCEKGTQTRQRTKAVEKYCGGSECSGAVLDTRTCNDVCCPVHCQWEEWTNWNTCSKTCGGGLRSRRRGVEVSAVCNGEECQGEMGQTEKCNTFCCPVDCILSTWGTWSACSTTCGVRGLQLRLREVSRSQECGGKPCDPKLEEDRPCNRVCFNGGLFGNETCACKPGWTGPCCEHDIDECTYTRCPTDSKCFNTDGSYDCICDHGYSKENDHCIDIDECLIESHDCHTEAQCVNMKGHYLCHCDPGFSGDGTFCEDIDECEEEIEYDNSTDDLSIAPTGVNIRSPLCHMQASCINTYGSYRCRCDDGFQGNGFTCSEIDECLEMSKHPENTGFEISGYNIDKCAETADCFNSIGGYDCMCKDGYYGSGFVCFEMKECESNPCINDGVCSDLINSFLCQCTKGYIGTLCEKDIDECWEENKRMEDESSGSGDHGASGRASGSDEMLCHRDSTCINTQGSYYCLCNNGYRGNGEMCTDIDECNIFKGKISYSGSGYDSSGLEESGSDEGYSGHECDENAMCINSAGSYYCLCYDGYHGNGFKCQDIDECESNLCQNSGICVNLIDHFQCQCKDGFTGTMCDEDIEECKTQTHECDKKHGRCINTHGTHICVCKSGFSGDGKKCVDIEECETNSHDCDVINGVCINTPGSHTCLCKPGYSGDGKNCVDIDECTAGFHNCKSKGQICKNTLGGYECDCEKNLEMKEGECKDVNECALGIHDCRGMYKECENRFGGYSCVCKKPLEMKNGECRERIPMSDEQSFENDSSSFVKKISRPPILAIIILTGVILIAIVCLIIRLSRRRYKPVAPTPIEASEGTFVERSETAVEENQL